MGSHVFFDVAFLCKASVAVAVGAGEGFLSCMGAHMPCDATLVRDDPVAALIRADARSGGGRARGRYRDRLLWPCGLVYQNSLHDVFVDLLMLSDPCKA